jgi:hypothetical protein
VPLLFISFSASPTTCGRHVDVVLIIVSKAPSESSGNMDSQRHSNVPMGEGLNDVKCMCIHSSERSWRTFNPSDGHRRLSKPEMRKVS